MGRLAFVLFATLLGLVSTLPAETRVLHEKRSVDVPSSWTKCGRVEPNAIVPVRIGLTQSNLDLGLDHLQRVSDPDSADFGKHLSSDEVHDLFAPSEETVEAVVRWLLSSGINRESFVQSENKGWIAAEIPARDAERLFSSELYEYEHRRNGQIRLGSDSYHLPAHLVEHIDYVTPGVAFSMVLNKRTRSIGKRSLQTLSAPAIPVSSNHRAANHPDDSSLPPELQHCDASVTMACIRALYNIPEGTKNLSGNDCGTFQQGSYFNGTELDISYREFNAGVAQGTRPKVLSIDGGKNNGVPGDDFEEASLDIYIITSLTYPQPVVVYQVDDLYYAPKEAVRLSHFNTFLDALDGSYCDYTAYGITGDSPAIDPQYPDPNSEGYKGQRQCGIYKPTRVISLSYGEAEADFPKNYVSRQCDEFMKLALQGHTLLFASGDFGVGAAPGDPSPSGCPHNESIFNAQYPSGCPYVTSVGATYISPGKSIHDPESALKASTQETGPLSHLRSAGGFSNYFPTAFYQKSAVDSYFASHDPGHKFYVANSNATNIGENGGLYNRAGRGWPDVSANGANIIRYLNGGLILDYGASASTPIWASVITLINGERAAAGKGPVGFINPTLYKNPSALNDIKHGSNGNCGSSGFNAVEGWDPVTGLGTPNYPALKDLFLGLP